MKKLITSLVVTSLILLITSTTKAQVRDTQDLKKPLLKLGLDWEEWLLIKVETLKLINKAADGYHGAVENLKKAQAKLDDTTTELNLTNEAKHKLEIENFDFKQRIMDLEDIEFFEHPAFWAAISFVVGAIGTAVLIITVK